MSNTNTATSKKNDIRTIAVCAVFTALTCVFTMFIQIPTGSAGGMVHIGNIPLFIAAAFFGKRTGSVVGGVGMALSDLLTGWVPWAPITLITVGIMGFVYALIVDRKPTLVRLIIASVAVLAVKVAGYYIGETIMYGSFLVPLASIPGNIIQIGVNSVIAIPVILILRATCENLINKLAPSAR